MAIETNAKRIVKVMKGETEIWADPTVEWLPCTTFKGDGSQHTATESIVLMHDNGNGTAILAGSVFLGNCKSGTLTVVKPPTGFKFTSVPNNFYVDDFRNMASQANVAVSNGNIVYKGDRDSYGSTSKTILHFGYPLPNISSSNDTTTAPASQLKISKV